MLTDIEKKVIASIQQDMPGHGAPLPCDRPRNWTSRRRPCWKPCAACPTRGVIRRFGATLRHQRTGYTANAMAAWRVDEERIDAVGTDHGLLPAGVPLLPPQPHPSWPYNLYTMIHAEDEDGLPRNRPADGARQPASTDYALLFSREELKKTSMVYFATGR
ncbi:MAG: Lrp/AsnC family transcriptional regulator [Desulfobacterales bacterium]|nr:Lrp/AsnC family transcriptional regulator [Desulfobacterales bacterium]